MVITDEQLPLLFFLIPLFFKGLIYGRGKKESGSFPSPNINKRRKFYLEQRKNLHVFQETSGSKCECEQ